MRNSRRTPSEQGGNNLFLNFVKLRIILQAFWVDFFLFFEDEVIQKRKITEKEWMCTGNSEKKRRMEERYSRCASLIRQRRIPGKTSQRLMPNEIKFTKYTCLPSRHTYQKRSLKQLFSLYGCRSVLTPFCFCRFFPYNFARKAN